MLDIMDALEEGWNRTTSYSGLVMMGLFFVLSLSSTFISAGIIAGAEGPIVIPGQLGMSDVVIRAEPLFAVPLSTGVLGLLGLVTAILSLVLTVGAVRSFASIHTERVNWDFFTERIGWRALNLFLGGITYAIIVAIGLVLLVLPGIYFLVTMVLWTPLVAVEARNFIEALQDSWRLSQGNVWALLGLGVLVVVIAAIITVVFAVPAFLEITPPIISLILSQIASAFTTVFALATITRAYIQIVEYEPEIEYGT